MAEGSVTRYRTVVADPPWPMEWSGGGTTRRKGNGVVYFNGNTTVDRLPYDLEVDAMYVDAHPFRFKGRTREQAIARASKWMERDNARERGHESLTTYVAPNP
jgi:hypothetical protein